MRRGETNKPLTEVLQPGFGRIIDSLLIHLWITYYLSMLIIDFIINYFIILIITHI